MAERTNNALKDVFVAVSVFAMLIGVIVALGWYSPSMSVNCDVRNGRCY